MNLPRRRRSRPKGRARLALAGDFPATDQDVTEAIQAIPPAPWHGTTIPLAALRGQPHYPHGPAEDWELAEIEAHIGTYAPAPVAGPPRTHQAAGKGWHMTVRTDGPGGTWNPRIRAAHTFLKLKWAYLEQRGMGYRIDEAEQVLERGEDLPAGSVIAETHREAVTHLVGDHGEWAPAGGWNHGWADSLPWYQPDDGDDGLPLGPRPDGAR